MINAHTHLYSGLAPLGMPAPATPPANFVEILERIWWRLDRALDAPSLRASAELYVADALAFGCRGLIDHHESPNLIEGSLDVIADVCEALGMPAILCYGATERNGGRDEARRGLAECERFIRENKRARVRGLVGLHASFTVSDETIQEAADLARSLDTVLHVHVAEDLADVEDARRRGYAGVIDRLIANEAMIPGSIFAHGVHLDRVEIRQIESAGIWMVQNPRSNQGNRVGYPSMLAFCEHVALGTDGYPAEMRAEEAALLEAAAAAGDDMARARRRLANGDALFASLYGEGPDAAGPVGAAKHDEIRARAATEARALWERMEAIE
ncbi:MAG: amidohydrolase family protein [Myxococcales bacterium]|nr:amidohydrolase family protein [Myxococcales bacterium]MCB9704104.1 amidohydrolase family protein [Myxococcales bacterium]